MSFCVCTAGGLQTTHESLGLFFPEVVLVVDLLQLVPIDLTPVATTMAFDFGSDFFVRSRGVFQFADRRAGPNRTSGLVFRLR